MKKISQLVDELLALQDKYALTHRGIITKERHDRLVKTGAVTLDYDDVRLREPLIEHVGHLPIIAAFLYLHIEHKDDVDLGKALTMLAIHDFGETIVGDVVTFAKTEDHIAAELEAVKKHLPPEYWPLFEEFEARETMTAKFAKAVDSISPILHEMPLPKVTMARFNHFNFDADKVEAKKRKDFDWDPVLDAILDELLKRYKEMG